MFGPLGVPELIIIFVVALIVFGPRKLPELGRSLGRGLSEFKRASNELRHSLEEEIRLEDDRDTRARTSKPKPETAKTPAKPAAKTQGASSQPATTPSTSPEGASAPAAAAPSSEAASDQTDPSGSRPVDESTPHKQTEDA